jgi:hypothetical protein
LSSGWYLTSSATTRRYIPIGNAVTLAHAPRAPILSLRGHKHGGDQQNGSNYLHLN